MTPSPNQDPTTANSELREKLRVFHYNERQGIELSEDHLDHIMQLIETELLEARREIVPGQISLCTKCNCMTKTVGRFASCGKCGAQKYFTQAELAQAVAEALNSFVQWHNGKYDTGYESGIANDHVAEYLQETHRALAADTPQQAYNHARYVLHSILSDDVDRELTHADIEEKFVAQLNPQKPITKEEK